MFLSILDTFYLDRISRPESTDQMDSEPAQDPPKSDEKTPLCQNSGVTVELNPKSATIDALASEGINLDSTINRCSKNFSK